MATQLFGVMTFVFGAYFLVHNRRTKDQVEAARRWPSAEGRILEAKVKRKGAKKPRYRAKIVYGYKVGGQSYKGKAIALGGEVTGGRKRAEDRVAKYPEGTTHPVFYDPRSPDTACLERVHEGSGLELMGAAFGMILGLALMLGYLPA